MGGGQVREEGKGTGRKRGEEIPYVLIQFTLN
jgi:hypothetical protein